MVANWDARALPGAARRDPAVLSPQGGRPEAAPSAQWSMASAAATDGARRASTGGAPGGRTTMAGRITEALRAAGTDDHPAEQWPALDASAWGTPVGYGSTASAWSSTPAPASSMDAAWAAAPTTEGLLRKMQALMDERERRDRADEIANKEKQAMLERMASMHEAQMRRVEELEKIVRNRDPRRAGPWGVHELSGMHAAASCAAADARSGDDLCDDGGGGWADDDDAASEASASTSVAGGAKLNCVFFTSSEMDAMKCDMTRRAVVDRVPEIRDGLEQRHHLIEELLSMDHDVWRDEVDRRADLREADRFVRRACKAAIGSGTDEATIFRADERALRHDDATESKRGRALLERMESFGVLVEAGDIRKHKADLLSNQYLAGGDSVMKLRAQCTKLREDWSMLPVKERSAIDLPRLLISKIPTSLMEDATRTFAERLEDEMVEHEQSGKKGDKWSFNALSKIIATRVAKEARVTLNAHPLTGLRGTVPGDPPRRKCFNCGKMPPDCAGWAACTAHERVKNGSEVGCVKGCPCVHGDACAIRKESMPEQAACKSGSGSKVTDRTYKKLVQAHADRKGGASGAAPTAAGERKRVTAVHGAHDSNGIEQVSTDGMRADDDAVSARRLCFCVRKQAPPSERERSCELATVLSYSDGDASGADERPAPAHVNALKQAPATVTPRGVRVEMLLDTGADTELMKSSVATAARPFARRVEEVTMPVDGFGGSSCASTRLHFAATLCGGRQPFALAPFAYDESGASMSINVVAHSYLEDSGIQLVYAPEMRAYDQMGGSAEIVRRDNVYWITLNLAIDDASALAMASAGNVNATVMRARASVGDKWHLWAARYGVSSQELPRIAQAVDGIDLAPVPKASAVLIDTDEAYLRAWRNRPSASQLTPARSLVTRAPGEAFAADNWYATVPSMRGQRTQVLHANCTTTSFGYAAGSKSHTLPAWVQFFQSLQLEERAIGHEIKILFVDAAGEFRHEISRNEIQQKCQVIVRVAAGDGHEFVSSVECEMDTTTRLTEMAMKRAKSADPPVPDAAMLECRMYQRQVLNQRPKAGARMSRWQHHRQVAPSARTAPPVLFWTRLTVHSLPQGRGPKGLMETDDANGRSRTGRVYGASYEDGVHKYTLIACDTKQDITRVTGTPLDEHVLLRSGVAAGGAMVDAETQMDATDMPLLTLLPPVEPAPPRVKQVLHYMLPEEDAPMVGDALDVMWQEPKGALWSWWRGTVEAIEQRTEGGRPAALYDVRYEKADADVYVHDLARDRLTNAHPWKLVTKRDASEPAAPAAKASAVPIAKQGPVTRAQSMRATIMAVRRFDSLTDLVEVSGDPLRTFNCLIDTHYGDSAAPFECASVAGLQSSMLAMRNAIIDGQGRLAKNAHAVAMAAKAAQPTAVKTPSGDTVMMTAPRGGCKALDAAPDGLQWYEMDHVAFYDSILGLRGNFLAPEAEIEAMGVELIPAVVHRRYKTHADTGELDKRKSRTSLDESQQYRRGGELTREVLDTLAAHTIPIGDMDMKLFCSSFESDDVLVVADWKDGYGIGECDRAPRAVRIPETVSAEDEHGRRMCLILCSGLWGEGSAGNGFEDARDADLAHAGWDAQLGTPAMFARADDRAVVIVDDLAMRVKDVDVAKRTVEVLSERAVARGGKPLTISIGATTYGGLQIMRSDDRMVLTLLMPQFIEGMAKKWLPTLVESGELPADVPQGKKLRNLLDTITLMPMERGVKLDKPQRMVQQITGDLRWCLRVSVRLVRAVHKLSCVAQCASPGSELAALGVVAVAWRHRYEGRSFGAASEASYTGFLKGALTTRKGASIAVVDGEARHTAGAPHELDGAADASWSNGEHGEKDVYGLALTNNGAAVHAELKSIGLILGDSTQAEGVASLKLSDRIMHGRTTLAALGCMQAEPTMLMSDNESNLRIAAGAPSAARLRHALRRWAIVTQRCHSEDVRLGHLRDEWNWTDFFTKWVPQIKVEAAIAYLTGKAARIAHPAKGDPFLAMADIGGTRTDI